MIQHMPYWNFNTKNYIYQNPEMIHAQKKTLEQPKLLTFLWPQQCPQVRRTCVGGRSSRERGPPSASSPDARQLCEAGRSNGEAVGAASEWQKYWRTPGWTAHRTSVYLHTVCSTQTEKNGEKINCQMCRNVKQFT